MKTYEATEQAYKNGYEKGRQDATDNNVGHKWIPVTERLPESGEKALCFLDRGEYWTAVWNDCADNLWSDGENWCSNGVVTHWMPLPQPPKGE